MKPQFVFRLLSLALLCASGCRAPRPRVRGVGDRLSAFIIQDCVKRSKYCQVCAFGGRPKIMIVGDVADSGFHGDLVRVQKLLDTHGGQGLTAFAVVGELDGRGGLRPTDGESVLGQLRELRERLALRYPVVIVPKDMNREQRENYAPFNAAYDIQRGRTIFFARADNLIVFADTILTERASEQFRELEARIKAAL